MYIFISPAVDVQIASFLTWVDAERFRRACALLHRSVSARLGGLPLWAGRPDAAFPCEPPVLARSYCCRHYGS